MTYDRRQYSVGSTARPASLMQHEVQAAGDRARRLQSPAARAQGRLYSSKAAAPASDSDPRGLTQTTHARSMRAARAAHGNGMGLLRSYAIIHFDVKQRRKTQLYLE
jgi:hypothetical protein